MDDRTWAFLDEFGDVNVDVTKAGVSTHFVVAAIVAPDGEVSALRQAVDAIRVRYCGVGKLRSKKLAKNPDRYAEVIREVCTTSLRFCALAVDKREIEPTSGLIYGQPFYKFLQRILYRQLFSTYGRLTIRADEYGDAEFMAGFRSYLLRERNPQLNLFADTQIEFASDDDEPLLQAADVVAGAIGRALNPDRSTDFVPLVDILRPRALVIQQWPTRLLGHAQPGREVAADDRSICQLAARRAEEFLAKRADVVPSEEVAQVRVLKKLLFESQFSEGDGFVSTAELQELLAAMGGDGPSELWVRSSVIAPLRDAGVLIASSPRGYKVPTCIADLQAFVDHADRVITPMAQRLKRARDAVKMLSHGHIDLLHGERYSVLASAVDALDGVASLVATSRDDTSRSSS